MSYRLTWEFPVDLGFYYFVRLHFCEIQPEMNATGTRVFTIFIANQIAEERADVFMWLGGKIFLIIGKTTYPNCNQTITRNNKFKEKQNRTLELISRFSHNK